MKRASNVGRAVAASIISALCVSAGLGRTAAARPDTAVVDLLNRYARGDFDGVIAELENVPNFKSLATDLRAAATKWIGIDAETSERRRLVVAAVALEASKIDIERFGAAPPGQRETAASMVPTLGWASDLLREAASPTPAERWWRLAEIALIERAHDGYMLSGFLAPSLDPRMVALIHTQHGSTVDQLGRARARFPDEPRFELAAVFDDEANRTSHWPVFLADLRLHGPDPVVARDPPMWRRIVDRYDVLARRNDIVRAEVLLRGGLIMLRLDDNAGALDRLTRVDSSATDDDVIYLSRLFAGKALERLERHDEAETSYRGALAVRPQTQSASAALAALLLADRDRAGAVTLVQAALSPHPVDDPWRAYNYGDWRLWPTFMKHVREALQ